MISSGSDRLYGGLMTATVYLDRRITPTRSLSKRGFTWLIGLVIVANGAMAVFFVAVLRAFPVPIFLGVDVLGVWLAFQVSYRRARQTERIHVTADEVRITHELGPRQRTIWTSPTAFTRVSVAAPGEHDAQVQLHVSGRSLTLAHDLGPTEREELATALEKAIREARAERW